MKNIRWVLLTVTLAFTFNFLNAQVTGIKTIPVDYPTIQAAIAALNLQGVGAGGATINVPGGYVETFTAQVVLTMTSNPSSQSNPLVIRRSGVGPNPLVRAWSPGVSTTIDGIFVINSCDYVTINGIDLLENPGNVTATQLMEWGYALVKTSGTNGCWNNTIKNCTVTLSNANPASIGIYIGNHVVTNLTGLTVTDISGTSSYNKFYNNFIQNCYGGYSFTGYASAVPYDFYDQNNIIGVDGISPFPSRVVKFGGGATQVNGIFATNQNNLKIHSTFINNSGAPNSTGSMYGIFLTGGTNSNLDVYGNTLSLILNSTSGSQLTGISCAMGGSGAGNTVNIYNNLVTSCSYTSNTSGIFRAIENTATSSFRAIFSNQITTNTVSGTGEFSGIYEDNNNSTLVLALKIYSNTISGNKKTGASGVFNGIYGNASANQYEVYSNLVSNNSATASSSGFYGYYNTMLCINESVHDNNFNNNSSGSGENISIYASAGSAPTHKEIYRNIINNITGNSATGSVGGIFIDFGTVCNVYANRISNLTNNTATGISPIVYGINVGTNNNTQCKVYNNAIHELFAPNANNVNAINGIWLQGSSASSIGAYFNTIYLTGSSTGVNFGTAALNCSNSLFDLDLRNNILVNSTAISGSGSAIAFVRGNASFANYNLFSGYNCFYVGTPGPNRLVYFDGTNSLQTLQSFKNFVGPREQSSFYEQPSFNFPASPIDVHVSNFYPSQCFKGGTPVGFITLDWDLQFRNPTKPCVGADEFVSPFADNACPNIQYPLLTNSPVAPNKIVTNWATITDPSGIKINPGVRPRLYYKKSTESNTYVGNTVSDNGWKYVEATNTVSPFSFNINYSLLFTGGNVVAGDLIQYFVTAQDSAGPIGINNGGFAAMPPSMNFNAAQFPLGNTINQYTIVTNMYSGTLNVGPTETVTSLTNPGGIFDLINQGVLGGNTTLNITGNLTTETGAIALNEWAEDGGGNYTLTIQPSAAATRTIMGSCTIGSLVRFNGADRVNIDGRFNNAGTWLTFRNTGQHSSIGFINDAQNNILQYSVIESGNQSTTPVNAGAVIIGTTSAMYGNDNITISDCEIRDRSDVIGNYPAWGINVSGTNGFLNQYNNNLVIGNNNIHDYFINGDSAKGIVIISGVSHGKITNNSLYHTSAKSHTTTSGGLMNGIFISQSSALNTSGGFTVTNNYVGGNAPLAAGITTLSVVGPTVYQSYLGLLVSTGQITNYVEGNVIRGIDFTTNSPTIALNVFTGLQIGSGVNSVGTQTGNVIGSPTGTGSIKITINSGGAVNSIISGILINPVSGLPDIRNNSVGSILLNGTSVTGTVTPQWIQNQGTPANACNIMYNLVGSTVTANSIVNNINAPTIACGLRHQISTGVSLTAFSNTIQNITDNSTNASSQHYGIWMLGTAGNSGAMNVSYNVVRDISSNALPPTFALVNCGMVFQGMAGTHTVDLNTVAGLNCINTGVGGASAVGIQSQGGIFGGYMRRNYINNITNLQTGTAAGITGISINSGSTWELSNNMISINNSGYTNPLNVNGVVDQMGVNSNLNFHYNSIYIGGGSPAGTLNSCGLYRGGSSNISMRNNLLYNERSSLSATHVAIGTAVGTNWGGVFSNYNAFLTIDTTKLAIWSGTATNFTGWKGYTLGDANSQKNITTSITASALFVSAFLGDLHMGTSVYPGGLATPISITTDFDNNGRGVTFPAVGADEIPCPVPIIAVATQSNPICFGGNEGLAIVTATGGLSHTYSWSPVSSTTNSITNLVAGSYTVKVTNHCALTGSLVVNITQPSTITPIGTWTDVTCFNSSNGIAAVIASGGTPGYTYSWSPASSTSSVAPNLAQGLQNYTVTDANGCTVSGTIVIFDNTTPVVAAFDYTSPACGTQSNGAASASVSGGTPAYTYSWTPNVSTFSVVTNIAAGPYIFQAADAYGCLSAPLSLTVGSIPAPTVLATSNTSIICTGQSSTLTANASSNVTYSWSSGGNTTTEIVTPTTTTQYTITVTDPNSCSTNAYVTVSVSTCTDLDKLTGNTEIQTFPNPNKGQLFVTYHGYTEGASVEVYNTVGQLIEKKKIESSTTEVDLSSSQNGLYLVKVVNAEGHVEQVTRVIKE